MERAGIVVGVDGDGGDPELRRRLRDPDCDLAAVGDEKLAEHRCGRMVTCLDG
jgi:hypothetical protein